MTPASPHDDWETHWDRYAGAASQNPAQYVRHEFVARILKRDARDVVRVFDIGSGQGDMLAILRPLFPKGDFLGVELSASGVAISKRKVPDATFVVADLFSPTSELAKFREWATDAVCSEVLEHVDDPTAFLQAARPYLAENSRLVVTVPGGAMSGFDKHIGHRQHFTKESISRILAASGFSVEFVYRTGFPFFNLYRSMVIARGARLVQDAEDPGGASSVVASLLMAVFRFLFRFNFNYSPFGWQIAAVGRKHKT